MLPDDPIHVFTVLQAKLSRYNPDAHNPEVLDSALGNAEAIKSRCGDNFDGLNLAVALKNHIQSLLRPDVELPNGELPKVAETRDAALSALASLRNLIVKH